jgi:hypothetical protein
MFRRFTSLLVVWIGLLSVIAPAITCAAAAQRADCCPLESPAPCGECPDGGAPSAPSPSHCVAPIVQIVAATAVSTAAAEQTSHPDTPALPALPDPVSFAFLRQAGPPPGLEPTRLNANGAAHTYLVTGRLRL